MRTSMSTRLRRILAQLFAMLFVAAGCVFGEGLIPSLVSCEPLRLSVPAHRVPLRLESSALDEPAAMRLGSAAIVLEYNAENLLRTKTGGRLTADMTTAGQEQTIFLPIGSERNSTALAFSHGSSSANFYYDDPEVGSEIAWRANSFKWAAARAVGKARIGVVSSTHSDAASGTSVYPQQVLGVFDGVADVRFDGQRRNLGAQIACRVSGSTYVRIGTGAGNWSYDSRVARNGTEVSLPIELDVRRYDIAVEQKLSPRTTVCTRYARGAGSGNDHVYLDAREVGKLEFLTRYSQFDLSVQYQPKETTAWQAGVVSRRRGLNLRGFGVRGEELGISVGPFNEMIDFDADIGLATRIYYLGLERRPSDKWRFGIRYKLIRMASNIDADYVGRMFFGLIYASGAYHNTPFDITAHGLQLSATYTHRDLATTVRLEQLIPARSRGGGAVAEEPRRSTGGTSLSLVCGCAF